MEREIMYRSGESMEDIYRKFASEHSESDETPDSQDLRIVLLGVCGAGKSATANAILGREAFKESRTRETEMQRGRVEDRSISIIDTPGFFNTQLTDEEQQEQMMKSLCLSHPGPHLFLLVINLETFREEQRNIVEQIQKIFGAQAVKLTMVLFIGRERDTQTRRKTVKWIQENFGKEATRYTIILFTRGDQLKGKTLDDYISENNDLKALVNERGDRFHLFNNEDMKNRSQVTELLEKIEKMVKENGGQHYTNEMYRKAQTEIEWEAQKQRVKRYGRTALEVIGGGTVVAGAVAVAGGPAAAVAAATIGAAVIGAAKQGLKL